MNVNRFFSPAEGEVVLIDKDLNWTSFNVVKKVKVLLSQKFELKKLKVGHAGTLDPLATGLVIVCTGKETKNIEKYQEQMKEYVAEITLGATTPSFDLETDIDERFPIEHITLEAVEKVITDFTGEQDQTPPVFSAKSVNGKRAYEYARKGKSVELKPNRVTFYGIELLEYDLPVLRLKIKCSKGTYIRAFAKDLGTALQSGAYLSALRRTAIGRNLVEEAYDIRQFEGFVDSLPGHESKNVDSE